jgi:hypothetical protein
MTRSTWGPPLEATAGGGPLDERGLEDNDGH